MRTILSVLFILSLLYSCDKKKEKASKISGTWEITETKVTSYVNNEPSGEELIDQSGNLVLDATGTDDNEAVTNLMYAPCPASCYWNLPRRKADQLYFYYYDADYTLITASRMLEKITKKEMVLLQVKYDNDLNILQTIRWTFRKGKLID